MNNQERENWIRNDESLYQWWKSSRLSMRKFVKTWKRDIDHHIESILGRKPR